jgi:hypothetical protein
MSENFSQHLETSEKFIIILNNFSHLLRQSRLNLLNFDQKVKTYKPYPKLLKQ